MVLWDLDAQSVRVKMDGGHDTGVNGAQMLGPDRVISWDKQGAIKVWDLEGSCLATLEGHTDLVEGLRYRRIILDHGHLEQA